MVSELLKRVDKKILLGIVSVIAVVFILMLLYVGIAEALAAAGLTGLTAGAGAAAAARQAQRDRNAALAEQIAQQRKRDQERLALARESGDRARATLDQLTPETKARLGKELLGKEASK